MGILVPVDAQPEVPSLQRVAVRGVAWATGQRVATRLVSGATFFLLARLLTPRDFGLVALASVFIIFVQLIVEQGLAQALIQQESVEPDDLDTVFWLNVGASVLLLGVLAACSTQIANLVDQPRLAGVLLAISIAALPGALTVVPAALLQRRFAFRLMGVRTIAAVAVGSAVALGMAIAGFGVWSLVAQMAVQGVVEAALLLSFARWTPRLRFSQSSFRRLGRFGGLILVGDVANFTSRRSDDLLVGSVLGSVALGIYSVAYRVLLVVTAVILDGVASVAYPVFSRLQSDAARAARAFCQATSLTVAVAGPTFAFISVSAPEFTRTVLGPHWGPSAPVLRVLALVGLLQSSHYLVSPLLVSRGRPSLNLRLSVVNAIGNLAGFLIAVHWGVLAVAIAYVVRGYALGWLPLVLAARVVPLRWRAYAGAVGPPLISVGAASAALVLARLTWLQQLGYGSLTLTLLDLAFFVPCYLLSFWIVAPVALMRMVGSILAGLNPEQPAYRASFSDFDQAASQEPGC